MSLFVFISLAFNLLNFCNANSFVRCGLKFEDLVQDNSAVSDSKMEETKLINHVEESSESELSDDDRAQIKNYNYYKDLKVIQTNGRVSCICPVADNKIASSYINANFNSDIRIVKSKSKKEWKYIPTGQDVMRSLLLVGRKTLVCGTVYGKTVFFDIYKEVTLQSSFSKDYNADDDIPDVNRNKILDFYTLDGNLYCIHKRSINKYDFKRKLWDNFWNFNGFEFCKGCVLSHNTLVIMNSQSLQLYDLQHEFFVKTINCPDYNLTAICRLSESLVAVGTQDGIILIIDLKNSTVIQKLCDSNNAWIDSLKLSPSGNIVYFAQTDNSIKICSPETKLPIYIDITFDEKFNIQEDNFQNLTLHPKATKRICCDCVIS